jgi:hypothetical protein
MEAGLRGIRTAKRNLIGRSSVKATDLRFVRETMLQLDPSLAGTEEDESYKTTLVLLSAPGLKLGLHAAAF